MGLPKEMLLAVGLGLVNGLLAIAVLSQIERFAGSLRHLVTRFLRPYDYTRDFYLDRDFAKKGESQIAKQIG